MCCRINEFAKQTQGEMGKMAQTRTMLFDTSFLMLCHISQVYGLEVNPCVLKYRGIISILRDQCFWIINFLLVCWDIVFWITGLFALQCKMNHYSITRL